MKHTQSTLCPHC